MQFNNTTTKDGLIQEFEFWTNLGDGTVSGDAVLLPQVTNRFNRSFDRIMPRVLSHDTNQRTSELKIPSLMATMPTSRASATFHALPKFRV